MAASHGVCRKLSPDEDNFCRSCGKPLRLMTPSAPSHKSRYSVILQSVPQDEVERFRVIKQLAGVMNVSEQEVRAKVENSPCVIASVESLMEAEGFRQALKPLAVTIFSPLERDEVASAGLVRCKSCDKEVARTARKCSHCGEMLIKCPACGGMSIGVGQRGFSLSAAAGGWFLVGPVGLLLGAAGRKQIELQCQNCGNRWVPA